MVDSPTLTVRARVTRGWRGSGCAGFTLDVDITVPPGITVLFGPSGAGKSTLLGAVAGLVTLEAGRIALGDRLLHDSATGFALPAHQRRIAYVFQSLALFPHLTALANVEYGIPRAVPAVERRRRALATLDRFSVAHVAHRRPETLSGGESQRVALARALATEPRAVLLDEPFSALDGALRDALTHDVRRLAASLRVPVVHVTHDRREARALGDRVLLMQEGRVVATGLPATLLADPDPG